MSISEFLKSTFTGKTIIKTLVEKDYSNVEVKSNTLLNNFFKALDVKDKTFFSGVKELVESDILKYEDEFNKGIDKYLSNSFIEDQATLIDGMIISYITNLSAFYNYLEDLVLYTIYYSRGEDYLSKATTKRISQNYNFFYSTAKDLKDGGFLDFIHNLDKIEPETIQDTVILDGFL